MKIHNPQASAMLFLTREGVGLRLKNPNAGASNQRQRLAGGCGGGRSWGRDAAGERCQDSKRLSHLSRGHRGAPLRPHWGHHARAPVREAPRRLSAQPGQLGPRTRQHRGGGAAGGRGGGKGRFRRRLQWENQKKRRWLRKWSLGCGSENKEAVVAQRRFAPPRAPRGPANALRSPPPGRDARTKSRRILESRRALQDPRLRRAARGIRVLNERPGCSGPGSLKATGSRLTAPRPHRASAPGTAAAAWPRPPRRVLSLSPAPLLSANWWRGATVALIGWRRSRSWRP